MLINKAMKKGYKIPHSPHLAKTEVFKKHQKIDKSCKINNLQDFLFMATAVIFKNTPKVCGKFVAILKSDKNCHKIEFKLPQKHL
ncbi:hypothetical protein [Chryseobacterium sp. EZn1]|uniref:hypothetical protein n=1 Tax=Chryseobacterium cupriresistens TaxID=3366770 RepID=UPI00398533CA